MAPLGRVQIARDAHAHSHALSHAVSAAECGVCVLPAASGCSAREIWPLSAVLLLVQLLRNVLSSLACGAWDSAASHLAVDRPRPPVKPAHRIRVELDQRPESVLRPHLACSADTSRCGQLAVMTARPVARERQCCMGCEVVTTTSKRVQQ